MIIKIAGDKCRNFSDKLHLVVGDAVVVVEGHAVFAGETADIPVVAKKFLVLPRLLLISLYSIL